VVAGNLSQDADIRVWDEVAFHKVDTKQNPDLLGVFTSTLFPFAIFTNLGLANTTRNRVFKDVEYRNPVLSGKVHAYIQTIMF